MSKKGKKWKESVPMQAVEDAIASAAEDKLLKIGKVVCPADYSVVHFENDNNKKFYHNGAELRRSLRRCLAAGAFDHRSTMIRMLDIKKSQ